ncbi:hypothetical protein ASPSYDRAFT_52816 [Aspergillus sydowii CBS 593.65]|uniref:Uncharacterized protein n=1 Tax=Aspergillus sydowii CBS 593.65 TaxID=1036612 RepID=A0A1L9SXL2_9EURO|nr:uncharacterized protein ASPSYDRAFT_52816 [Aspergillus sydowii CBS 593.65]OJJ51924.1 hypothetical protein ASPSYDRAFT_52816 [Aspergillus sydowii CBS 593.65]
MPWEALPTYELEARRKNDIPLQATLIALPVISIFAGSVVGCPQLGLLDAQSLSYEAQLLLKTSGSIQPMATPLP